MRLLPIVALLLLAAAYAGGPAPAPAGVDSGVDYCAGAPDLDDALRPFPSVPMPVVPYERDTSYAISVPTFVREQERRLEACADAYANKAGFRALLHDPAARERIHGWVLHGR